MAPRSRAPAVTVPTLRCDGAAGEPLAPPYAPAVSFASCYVYAPLGDGPLCEAARQMCARLKEADARWLARFAVQVWRENAANGRFVELFGRDVVLVPVPGSRPGGVPWVGERLARCLQDLGLACAVWPCLRRCYPVRKSAFAAAGQRPSVREHYASFAVERWPASPDRLAGTRRMSCADGASHDLRALRLRGAGSAHRLVLIDDVVTRGRTLLAAAARLREAFPQCEIRAFALMRTLGRGQLPWRNPDPCEGQVRWLRGDARRIP